MKIRFIYILIALVTIGTMSSCDDFLTKENPNQITVDNFWNNLEDCEKGMVTVYNQLRRQNMHQVVAENLRSDMAYPGLGRPTPTNANNARFYNQVFSNTDGAPNQKWAELYIGIFRTNQVIKGLEGIKDDMLSDKDKLSWKHLMAEARFFRGYFHYWAASSFNKGEVIIYDFVPVDESKGEHYQPLSSEEKVREFYRNDLKYAFDSLPAVGQWERYEYGEKATRYAAAFALAQSYLSQPSGVDYESAKFYLADIIESGQFSLAEINENMTTDGENNVESILEIAYDRDLKPESGNYSPANSTYSNYAQMISSMGGWRNIYPSCWLTMAYKGDSLDINDQRNMHYYENENGEIKNVVKPYSLRTSYSIALADDSLEYYGGQPGAVSNFQYDQGTSLFRKLTNWDICENENELNARSGVNYRLMRLADVYLMYAECLIEGGSNGSNTAEAIKYINKVRYRAGLRLLGEASNGEWPELGKPGIHPETNQDTTIYTYFGNIMDYRNIRGQENPNEPIIDADSGIDQRVLVDITDPKVLMEWLMFVERPLELSIEGMDTRLIDLRRWSNNLAWFDLGDYFKTLASNTYQGDNFAFTNPNNGNSGTRYNALLFHGVKDPKKQVFVDYEQAANNYIEGVHAYWPIPTQEIIANPNL
ncbi:RagB/SusD family nutrient uptake outer membrane protein [Saccharicrinis aurantiacus]|uniref:RagB/SusD family nutrient uptake outer membrane protein n=1 Tax=Saccharicrinis aurantiacus TaxID=1849719 RepID=UPI0024916FF9|nr:RagB/SusD family nutrient uptake outer membrane protein [Saccharicrinis aurantiacus]